MTALHQSKRIIIDALLGVAILALYLTGFYTSLPAPIQLITLKMVLVSMAFVHAHFVGKIAFGKVDWSEEKMSAVKVLRIALYVAFIYAYSTGG